MRKLNVLSIQRTSAEARSRITAVDPAIALTDAGGWFDGEIRDTWPAHTVERYLLSEASGEGSRARPGDPGSARRRASHHAPAWHRA